MPPCPHFGQILDWLVNGKSPGGAYWSSKMTIDGVSRVLESVFNEAMATTQAGYMCSCWDGVFYAQAEKGYCKAKG